MADQGEKIAKIVTTITSGLSTMTMAFGSMSSIMNTLFDDTASWGNKITQILTTGIPSILMFVSSFNKLNEVLGLEGGLFKTLGSLMDAHKAVRDANTMSIEAQTKAEEAQIKIEEAEIAAKNANILATKKQVAEKQALQAAEALHNDGQKYFIDKLVKEKEQLIENALATGELTDAQIAQNVIQNESLKDKQSQTKYLKALIAQKRADMMATKAQSVATKAQTDADNAQTVAIETQTAATKAQTTAQEGLNAAESKSKIGIIITAIAAGIVVIKGIITLVDKLTMSAKEAEEQISSFNEKMKEFGNESSTYQNDVENLQAMSDEYDELSKKAGAYDANIANLTESERKRYNEIKNQLVEYNSGLLGFYNEQGEAILNNNDAIRETIELLKQEYEEKKKQLYVGEDANKTAKAYDTSYEKAKKNANKNIIDDKTYLDKNSCKMEAIVAKGQNH